MKSVNSKVLSGIAIILSVVAIIITWLRVEVTIENDTFVGIMAGFMGVCATILVGAQIYNSIDTKNTINKLNDSLNSRIEELNKLQDKINKDIEYLKKEKEKGSYFTMYGVSYAIGVSNVSNHPVYSFTNFIDALVSAMKLDNSAYVANVLGQLETLRSIINEDITKYQFTIPEEKIRKIKEYHNLTLIKPQLNSILRSFKIKEI